MIGRLARWSTCLTIILGGGCGGIRPVDVHDERLPLEARLWVGGAEDALAIARAGLDDARSALAELEAWADGLPKEGDVGPRAAGLVKPMEALADARVTVAEQRLAKARAEVAVARAALDLVYAETDMRYDLGVHDLAALRTTRDAALRDLEQSGVQVDEATVLLDRISSDFWSAYRAQASGGGTDALWWLAAP